MATTPFLGGAVDQLFSLGYRSIALLAVIALVLLIALKRRYLSPISDIPGPFVASFSIWWQIYHIIKGHTEKEMIKRHRELGPFVRIADNEVSVCHPDAVKQLLSKPIPKVRRHTACLSSA
jgi:hypothetical protein